VSPPAQTLFASDLHLDSEAPWAIDAFLAFLDGVAREAEALYLLGDLFEAWVGDDDDDPDNARACAGLARLSASNSVPAPNYCRIQWPPIFTAYPR
jgi:UDP-2,3-diacylglucosamine hydrolase